MIHDQDLQMVLCVEVCKSIVYIQNRYFHRILEDRTLEKAFIGIKIEASHFHIVGCPVHIHIPLEKRTKLESKRKGLFVGYSEISEDYKVCIQE